MKPIVFLDSAVFIFASEFNNSNSAKVIELLISNKIKVIISEKVLKEVTSYFEKFYTIKDARKMRRLITSSCTMVKRKFVEDKISLLKGKIKEKDLEHLAVVRKLGIKYLISYDKDFKNIQEYLTPKQFITLLGEKSNKEEF